MPQIWRFDLCKCFFELRDECLRIAEILKPAALRQSCPEQQGKDCVPLPRAVDDRLTVEVIAAHRVHGSYAPGAEGDARG